ncbi:CU044_5270 family protein [Actinomadura roseirufa]|uniref:CU044_5270 family protein n=1 Tax=Actinomadura roseirufa TaxID=2094049 RepID=UPI0010414CA4|nr:CU044_5270 family protein [Actinomadura roseirufa]
MDEFDALRQMRTALAEEEHPHAIELRSDWRTGRKGGGVRRPRSRFVLPLVSLGATAAVTAGVIAAVSEEPDDARGGTGTLSHEEQGSVLLVAATNALRAPAGAYWHTKSVSGEVYGVGTSAANHYKVDSRQGVDRWTDRKGKGRQTHLDLVDVPVTAQDKQKWQAAGSPTWVQVPLPGVPDQKAFLDMSAKPKGSGTRWMPFDGRYYGLSAAAVAELPTRPQALEKALLALKGDWHAYTSKPKKEPLGDLQGTERARALSDVVGTLLSDAPAPPAVRAAAFRVLATLPGIRPEGGATDPLGRRGTVVSLPLETTVTLGLYTAPQQLGTYRRQFIIDPAAGKLLAIRDLVVTPPHGSRRLPPGDNGKPRILRADQMPDRFHRPGEPVSYQVFEVAEWTNERPPS